PVLPDSDHAHPHPAVLAPEPIQRRGHPIEAIRPAFEGNGNSAATDRCQKPKRQVLYADLERRPELHGPNRLVPSRQELKIRHVTSCSPARIEVELNPFQFLPSVHPHPSAFVQPQERPPQITEYGREGR